MVWNFLKKLKTELPYYPAIPPLGVYPGKWKRDVHRKSCTQIFTLALCTYSTSGNNPTAAKR